ncbi:hypothetical protein WJX74_002015 [Apatococcus lobatus]
MSPRNIPGLQTIPENEAVTPQQPDCLALLDVLQRDGFPLKDALNVLPQHLQLLKPLLETLDHGQDLPEPAACSNRRGRSLLRLALQASQWTPTWTELARHLVPTLAGVTGTVLRQCLQMLPSLLPDAAYVPLGSQSEHQDLPQLPLESSNPMLTSLSGMMPAVEAWLEHEALCSTVELAHQPQPYQPSTKAEQLDELLAQAASPRSKHAEDTAVSEMDAAVVLLEEGFGLKVGNFVQQRRLQKATCGLLSMHDTHTATLSQLDEVTQDCFVVNHVPTTCSSAPEQRAGSFLAQIVAATWWPW